MDDRELDNRLAGIETGIMVLLRHHGLVKEEEEIKKPTIQPEKPPPPIPEPPIPQPPPPPNIRQEQDEQI